MEKIKIDLLPSGVMATAHASQYDIGRTIRFYLTDEGVTYTLAGTEVITMKLRKPDGSDDTISLTNTSSNYVDWTTDDGDLNLSGAYLAEITITSGSDVLGTANFLLKVEPDAYDGKNIRVLSIGPLPICTFDTTLAEPLISVKCAITPTQSGSGTPYPAGGGKNKIEGRSTATTEHDITVTPKGDGTFDVHGTASANCYISISSTALASGSYTLNGDASGFGTDMYLYCMPSYNRGTFTSNIEGVYLYVKSGTEVNHATIKPMVRLSTETDPTFAPYSNIRPLIGYTSLNLTANGDTTEIDLNGTIYGGSLDVSTGVLTVTHGYIRLDGTQSDSDFQVSTDTGFTQISYLPYISIGVKNAEFVCSTLELATYATRGLNKIWGSGSAARMFLGLPDTVTTVAEMQTWFTNNPTEVAYPLATPFTVQLTPTQVRALVGSNNVYCDTGDTEVKYLDLEV